MSKTFVCTLTEPVVETKYGKLRGFKLGGIYNFYGIKYADAKRFRMPEEVQPWDGIKDAHSYGYTAPLMEEESRLDDITIPHRFWPQNEDCQYLNIWTPSLDRSVKKPVIVWIHGGAYMGGSSVEMPAYDGYNLSEFGDMVVVSVNHRLNILGYCDLSSFGDRYWNTANLGQADLVAALKWVHENIEGFGGDPENVTIFGQSGGGGKVHALLQTPAADGLFHKAIIESGMWADDGLVHSDRDEWHEIIEAMLAKLGFSKPEELETIPYRELVNAYKAVVPAMRAAGKKIGFAPIQNDWFLGNALDVGLVEHAKTIPVIVGSTFADFTFDFRIRDKNLLSEEQRVEVVRKKYGEHADEMMELFRKAYPGKNIADTAALDCFFRAPTIRFMDLKAAAGGSDNYSYVFALDFDLDGGRPAWHCSEIPFAFHNIDKCPVCNIPEVGERLEAEVASAWVNFARTGNPSSEYLEWPAYKVGSEATMVFDRKSEARVDFDREIIAGVEKYAPKMRPEEAPREDK